MRKTIVFFIVLSMFNFSCQEVPAPLGFLEVINNLDKTVALRGRGETYNFNWDNIVQHTTRKETIFADNYSIQVIAFGFSRTYQVLVPKNGTGTLIIEY